MNKDTIYYRQVQLLVRVLPLIAVEKCFALKGGTAINLFYRDMPRLSVDIDLHYTALDDRDTALQTIRAALARISESIKRVLPEINVINTFEGTESLRIFVTQKDARIKIELSPVIRGSVFPEKNMEVSKTVQKDFGYAEIAVAAFPDLYAGKICAALDRQHPRDLFDVKYLFDNEGITDHLRKTFLVYLISHQRPMAELLSPERKNISSIYESEFARMARIEVPLSELETVRERLITELNAGLTESEKQFLLSFKRRAPQWELLGIDKIQFLPSVRWKMLNLEKMKHDKHLQALKKLELILYNKSVS